MHDIYNKVEFMQKQNIYLFKIGIIFLGKTRGFQRKEENQILEGILKEVSRIKDMFLIDSGSNNIITYYHAAKKSRSKTYKPQEVSCYGNNRRKVNNWANEKEFSYFYGNRRRKKLGNCLSS